jgi:serine/threonine-protein kinase
MLVICSSLLETTSHYLIIPEEMTRGDKRFSYSFSPLTPPKRIVPSISDRLNKAILKGMALEAKDRPQSMRAWLKMLEAPKATPPRIIPWGWLVGVLSGVSDRLNQAILKGMTLEAKKRSQSMQDWLAMLEAPKAVPPRIIPWHWLVGVLLTYLLIGYLLPASNASYIVWIIGAVAVGCPVVVAVGWGDSAVGWDRDSAVGCVGCVPGAVVGWVLAVTPAGAWAGYWVGWAGRWAKAWAGAGAWAWAGAVASAVTLAVTWFVAYLVALYVGAAVGVALVEAGQELKKSFSKVHTFLILASTSSLGLGLGWLGHRIFNTGS